MRYKINKKDFEGLLSNRKLTKKERYWQDFWLCKDEGNNYWIEQKLNPYAITFTITILMLCAPFILLVTVVTNGVQGVFELFNEIEWTTTTRVDTLHKGLDFTDKLIALTVKVDK